MVSNDPDPSDDQELDALLRRSDQVMHDALGDIVDADVGLAQVEDQARRRAASATGSPDRDSRFLSGSSEHPRWSRTSPQPSIGCLVFISYRSSDQSWATELVYARLTEAFGADAVFKGGTPIQAGGAFAQVLRREAASCPLMLACIGPGWLTATVSDGSRSLDSPDDWVREEIAISLQAGNYVVPLLIGRVAAPEPDQVPEPIRAIVDRQAWRLDPGGGLNTTIPLLIDRLAELVPELAERRRVRPTTVRGAPIAIEDELATLADSMAVTLVTAMGTSAWTNVRDAVTVVFQWGGTKGHDRISNRLEDDASMVASADDQAAERAVLEPFWRLRFSELVTATPECALVLAEIIRTRDEATPPVAGTHPEQHTPAQDFATAFMVRGGNVIVHEDLTTPTQPDNTELPGSDDRNDDEAS